ncbi:hypothetical protein MNBD_BACTEROID06-271 [hydrothermal vent metagenome]|uniref:Methyltransferase domain-containing protein n=1 Tax=hydrothermal vent metagenome TaxID=652676 RepID=A0A3B0UDJ1_9ZZZZ
MNPLSDHKIIHSWKQNASPWIKAIDNDEIESRITTTNKAIITQIKKQAPTSVIDIGCGEGWLVNALAKEGIDTLGIDAIPAFIHYANKHKKGRYKNLSYEELATKPVKEKFDLAVSNFSLLGEESVELVFNKVPNLLTPKGGFLVQTIHPCFVNNIETYTNGWQTGSWKGFNSDFKDPAPWYFRTLSSWSALFNKNGLSLRHIYEPKDKTSGQIASIIFYAKLAN